MDYRRLGQSDLEISEIGYGAWGIGGAPFWTNDGDAASARSIHQAVDNGINVFDTAPVYGFGHSECVLGEALRPIRDRVFIATKCGLRWDREHAAAIRRDSSRGSIVRDVEESLSRLQTDRIDLCQVHWPDEATPQAETMAALTALQEQGKIRWIGVSNYTVAQLDACRENATVVALQVQYSLLNRSIEADLVPYCLEHNIGILAYSPLASGVLTGKYDRNTRFTDWRKSGHLGDFRGDGFVRNIEKVERLKQIAATTGRSCTQLAINALLRQPGVTSALVGVKNADQVAHNIAATGWAPEIDVAADIEAIFAA